MPTHKRLLLSVVALSGVSLLFGPEAQAHSKHNHHHGHHHGHHKHSHKKAKAYNKGYRQGIKTAMYGYNYGYGYRPHSRPIVVTPAPWGAPPVHVGQPKFGFGFYF